MPTLQNTYFFHNLMGKTYSLESGNMLIQGKLTQIHGVNLGQEKRR